MIKNLCVATKTTAATLTAEWTERLPDGLCSSALSHPAPETARLHEVSRAGRVLGDAQRECSLPSRVLAPASTLRTPVGRQNSCVRPLKVKVAVDT